MFMPMTISSGSADFSLPTFCQMNGLYTSRSALSPQVSQIVDVGGLKPANAAEAALLPIFPPSKKEGGFGCLK
jgi:hypothetical protein